ncbi:hypothetical protein L9F63_011040, partial [Diploptera punctata]
IAFFVDSSFSKKILIIWVLSPLAVMIRVSFLNLISWSCSSFLKSFMSMSLFGSYVTGLTIEENSLSFFY